MNEPKEKKCEGNCTFTSTVTCTLQPNNDISEFEWISEKAQTVDCNVEIGDGSGWFRFHRERDGRTHRISRETILGADQAQGGTGVTTPDHQAGDGSSLITGGALPRDVTVRKSRDGSYTGIKVGTRGGDRFLSIDLFVALTTNCNCPPNVNMGELVFRLKIDRAAAANQQVEHNNATRSEIPNPEAPGRIVEYVWSTNADCDVSGNVHALSDLLGTWEGLVEQPVTPEQEQSLQSLIQQLNSQAPATSGPLIPPSPPAGGTPGGSSSGTGGTPPGQ